MGLIQSSGKKFTDANTLSSVTFNAASNFTAGNTVVISLVHFNSAAAYITGITVSGTSATRSVQKIDTSTLNTAEIWIASNVSGGSSAVVISFAVGNRYITCGIDEWDNITTSSPLDQTGTGGQSTSSSPSVTSAGATSQADEVVYAVFCDYVGTNWTSATPPGSYTESWEEPDGSTREAGSGAYRVVSATGSQTATFTTGSSMSWVSAMATYKLTGGGPPNTAFLTLPPLMPAAARR